MHKKIVDISLRYRFFVILGVIGITALGIYQYSQLPVDAFPDISPVMVPVFAEAHGMAPEEVERLITFPIESAMNGLPSVRQIKSTSAFGMAVIYVYFEDDVDIYFARQIVSERLNEALAQPPEMHEPPALGPISTGLGQIFIYYLTIDSDVDTGGKEPTTYLREINDWVVKYQLQTVPGVTDILSIGGHVLQYQIRINPHALNKYKISLEEVVESVRENNKNAGGQFMLLGSEEYLVRGIGLLQDLNDIRNIHVKVIEGVPIKIGDLAEIGYGKEIRRGVVSRNGSEEVVSGMVLQLYGQNTSKVIERLYDKIPEVQASLPDGVSLVPYYEQAELIKQATWTVKKALLQGAVLVIIVLFCFLGNFRSAFIVSLALPLCALISIIFMRLMGISANLMSLGGIAIGIGMLGDGAIVMVENIYRHLNANIGTLRKKTDIIFESAKEVSRPIIFSIIIIITVFLPIFSLEGVEGKMFSPMAFTLCFALFGSLIVAVVAAPALCTYLLKAGRHKEFIVVTKLKKIYRPWLIWAISNRKKVLWGVLIAFVCSISLVPLLGTEFIPTLEEGSILIGVTMAPSISLQKGTQVIQALERKIIAFEEVEEVVSRIGRPEAGSHPHPVNYAEIHIELKLPDDWPAAYKSKKDLIEALNESLSNYPGVQLNFTQPIQNAFDELLSGIKAQVAVKLFGEDLDVLKSKAQEIHNSIGNIPGLVDLAVEQSFGQPQIQIIADRRACSRYGINVSEILELVELAIGGEVIDNIYLNIRRFGIHVRYQEPYRSDPKVIEDLLVHAENGTLVPLKQVAQIKEVIGPIQINREKNQRRWVIQGNVRGRDLGSVVADIKKSIANNVELPPGYHVEYGGQFENQQRAMTRLAIIVPIVITLVFLILCLMFGSIGEALLIIINVPLALIGGILGLFLAGEYLSVPAAVGFIALFGIAVQNGVVLVSCINQLCTQGIEMKEAIITGALQRLRPVLMTAATTVLGLLPLLLSRGIGSEVQRPLAAVVIFGLTSATLLTLFVIPAFYQWFAVKINDRTDNN